MKIDLSILGFMVFAVLLVCKLTGAAAISWWVVFSPLLVVLGLVTVLVLIMIVGFISVLLRG